MTTNIEYDYPPANGLATGTVDAPEGGLAPIGFNVLDVLTTDRLAALLAAEDGATLVGYNSSVDYPPGTVGYAIKQGITPSPINANDVIFTPAGGIAATNVQDAIEEVASFEQSGTGAVERTQQDKSRDFVSVNDFDAVGDGTTDDTTAFANALASLGVLGGTVYYNKRHLIDNDLTIPANCTLKGPYSQIGSPSSNLGTLNYTDKAALFVNSAKSIFLSSGSGLDGCLVIRKGMTTRAATSAAFAGKAIRVDGSVAPQDDTFLKNSMVIGFEFGFHSVSNQRPRVTACNMDNLTNVYIENCLDVPYIDKIHGWPFSTIGSVTPGALDRSGSHIQLAGVGDWTKVTNCFSYGYKKSYYVTDSDDTHFINCAADGTVVGGYLAGSSGFTFDGTCERPKMIGCIVATHEVGVLMNSVGPTEPNLEMIGCNIRVQKDHGLIIYNGNVVVNGGNFSDEIGSASAMTLASATSKLRVVGGTKFYNVANVLFLAVSSSLSNVYFDPSIDLGSFAGTVFNGTVGIPTIASADPLPIPTQGEFFAVSGTTSFTQIQYPWTGRRLTLTFTGDLVASNSGATNGLALNNEELKTRSGATLSLISDGSRWIEVGRSNGARTRVVGTAGITAGATSVAVTHGLVAAPTSVSITPRGTDLGGTSFWTDGGATPSVTIRIGAAKAFDVFFDYDFEVV